MGRQAVKLGYRLRVFLVLSLLLAAASVAWSVFRWESHAPAREAWERVTSSLRAQKVQIDSLEAAIEAARGRVDEDKSRLESIGRRIGHYEGRAVNGRLPTPQYRAYRTEIERHNEVVERHNVELAALQALYRRYSALVDLHNALVDSANALQDRAVEEGIQLPEADLE